MATLHVGAVVKVANNSNLLIDQSFEEQGLFRKIKTVKRTLRVMLGKVLVKTGDSTAYLQTVLQTPTTVCALRGTVVTLSIDRVGQPYIRFSEGGAAFSVGDFITGIAEDVPAAFADQDPVQRAAFVARAAAVQAARASEQAALGEISDAQAALLEAKAAEASAMEVKIQAAIMLRDNPDPAVVTAAEQAIQKADEAIDQAEDLQRKAMEDGAVEAEPDPRHPGEPEAYQPPLQDKLRGTDIPVVNPEPPIQDLPPASPV